MSESAQTDPRIDNQGVIHDSWCNIANYTSGVCNCHLSTIASLTEKVSKAELKYEQMYQAGATLEAENASLTEKVERYTDVLERIVDWSKAYPIDVFPEPDLKKAHKILKANGMTLDAISASAMRHVVIGVGKMAANALLESE